MDAPWLVALDQKRSSYSVLAGLLGAGLAAGGLFKIGLIGWALGLFGRVVRWSVRAGFRTWEVCLSWAHWGVFLGIALAVLTVGALFAADVPPVAVGCGLLAAVMGAATCLAYMFIDLERYEVGRGYKAVHNPMKGQAPAVYLARYGDRVGVPLLVSAAVAAIGGFALLNQGLYEAGGQGWYAVSDPDGPAFVDFLAYSLVHLLRVVDVLDLADSKQLIHVSLVRQAAWPATVLLAGFKSFFTLVLLQQVFASVRQGRLLAETIADFWSPHEPIHARARTALPQYGAAAIGPILVSLRSATALTKEQRDQLPPILAAIGPCTVPVLTRHLADPHEDVRAVAAAALGHLHTRDAVPHLARLATDPGDHVRQAAAEALGQIGAALAKAARAPRWRDERPARRWPWAGRSRRKQPAGDPTELCVATLRSLLGDDLALIRGQAAESLGEIGSAAGAATDELADLLHDADESVRCRAAVALGRVGADADGAAVALETALDDAAAAVRAAAARGLGFMGRAAAAAAPRLVQLLQDRDDGVRAEAADAVARIGPLDDEATAGLVEGLASPDNVVRAQTAEALGRVGAPAEEAAPALVEALADRNDVVRAKAVEALGKIGEAAADVAVPSLVRALHDRDSWVSALAAEALGKQGDGAAVARAALERAAGDEDGGVRAAAVRALGGLGDPTPTTLRLARAALADPDPVVRAAAVTAVGAWDRPADEVAADLLPLLADPNDRVKVRVAEVLPGRAGADGAVVEGLCRALREDDSTWVQIHAALALARLGPAAAAAGPDLLRAARTAEAAVREQAVRALAMIQPPEAVEAFVAGMKDASADVRLLASAGWMKMHAIPDDAVAALVDALRDPEPQVRANAAHALGRLDALPPAAVPALRECAADPVEALRLNAAVALRLAPPAEAAAALAPLLADPSVKVRLVAARGLLAADPADPAAEAVVREALADPSPRVREAAEELARNLPVEGHEPAAAVAGDPNHVGVAEALPAAD